MPSKYFLPFHSFEYPPSKSWARPCMQAGPELYLAASLSLHMQAGICICIVQTLGKSCKLPYNTCCLRVSNGTYLLDTTTAAIMRARAQLQCLCLPGCKQTTSRDGWAQAAAANHHGHRKGACRRCVRTVACRPPWFVSRGEWSRLIGQGFKGLM